MTGLNKYSDKDKRRMRMRNHIAKDLALPKYRQQVIPDRKKNIRYEEDDELDDE